MKLVFQCELERRSRGKVAAGFEPTAHLGAGVSVADRLPATTKKGAVLPARTSAPRRTASPGAIWRCGPRGLGLWRPVKKKALPARRTRGREPALSLLQRETKIGIVRSKKEEPFKRIERGKRGTSQPDLLLIPGALGGDRGKLRRAVSSKDQTPSNPPRSGRIGRVNLCYQNRADQKG